MGDCKRNAGVAVMETSSTAVMAKRRKINQLQYSSTRPIDHELGIRRCRKMVNSAGETSSSFSSDRSPAASCCSSNESSEVVKDILPLVDLEAKSFETSDSTSINNSKKFRETTPSSEVCGDSDETESAAAARNLRQSTAAKFPPKEEIEEFFAMAEKSEQKRFTEKYNYDIVNDMPLEGRYQWVCLKP